MMQISIKYLTAHAPEVYILQGNFHSFWTESVEIELCSNCELLLDSLVEMSPPPHVRLAHLTDFHISFNLSKRSDNFGSKNLRDISLRHDVCR